MLREMHNEFRLVVVFLLLVDFGHGSQSTYSGTQWTCNKNQRCVRHSDAKSQVATNTAGVYESQDICRLVCGRYGALWPLPTGFSTLSQKLVEFNPQNVEFTFGNSPTATHKTLTAMTGIFLHNIRTECGHNCTLTSPNEIHIQLNIRSDNVALIWKTNETYEVAITSEHVTTESMYKVAVQIIADTVFGGRHALETVSQMVAATRGPPGSNTMGVVIIGAANIQDAPVYGHRGLLLDTARNFIPLANIRRTIDGMAASKLNVFHWHIADSQSFPMEVPRVPQMAMYGAYSPYEVYRHTDLVDIVVYARNRGVRIIMELGATHAGNGWQWGPSAGLGNLAVCVNQQPWRQFCVEAPCGQLNPANPNLFHVMGDIYKDLLDIITPGELFHMGGDEMVFACWNSSSEIVELLASRGLGRDTADFLQLWAEYQATALQLWDEENGYTLRNRDAVQQTPNPVILWSSQLTNPATIEKYLQNDRYIIQTWVEASNDIPAQLMAKGYRVIMSTKDAWYLDHGFWGRTVYHSWRVAYKNRLPRSQQVVGGEACMWTEFVDENSMDSRIWPRAAAVAERLWSDPDTDAIAAEGRFYRHRERLVRRHLRAEAITPKWCALNEGECF